MRIIYRGQYEQIKLAVEDANFLLSTEEFFRRIAEIDHFECSKKYPKEISEIIFKSKLEVEVKLYKPKWIFSDVNGYFAKSYPNSLFLNIRKIWRNTEEISNTIIHEYVHALDNEQNNELIEFGHNCGILSGTAPYVIGDIAEKMINGENSGASFVQDRKIEILPNRII